MPKVFKCIDAGSEYCPCELAGTMDCISCSLLQNSDVCDCIWNGVCIYNEYYMNNGKTKEGRKTYIGNKIYNEKLGDNLFIMKIETEGELIDELNRPGAYIFLRSEDKKSYFNVPMSILDVSENRYIYIAYQDLGCKTKSLKDASTYLIKGPFWNGILGIKYLKEVESSNCLIISKGIGQSSLTFPIRDMKKNKNNIILYLDKGKLDSEYILNFIDVQNIKVIKGNILRDKDLIVDLILKGKIELVFSAGSDLLHQSVYEIIKNTDACIKFMTTNNNRLCCGEGVCGSCLNRSNKGYKVRTCKAEVNPKIFY